MTGLFLAALLAQAAPRPQAVPPAPPREARPPLSREDEELVRQLALLERVELLQNLELFEGGQQDDDAPPAPPTRTP